MRFLFSLLFFIGILPLIFSSSLPSAVEKYGGGYLNDDEAMPWVPKGHPFRSHSAWLGPRDSSMMNPLGGSTTAAPHSSEPHSSEAPHSAAHWSYEKNDAEHGPYGWSHIDKRCSGLKQSPINFELSTITNNNHGNNNNNIMIDRSLGCIQENWGHLIDGSITHNGHTIIYNVHPSRTTNTSFYAMKGGAVNRNTYKLAQFHIHIGSEHTFNGAQYPLELHAVHLNVDPAKAVEGHPEELAVVGFTFRETQTDNPALAPLIKAAEELTKARITHPDATITMPVFNLTALVPDNHNYFTYQGSLTTPNCRESVTWHVYEKQVPIGGRQLEKLIEAQGFSQNYRPVQPLNGRKIRAYHQY